MCSFFNGPVRQASSAFCIFLLSEIPSVCTKSMAYVLCSLKQFPKYLFDSQNREADLLIQGQQTFPVKVKIVNIVGCARQRWVEFGSWAVDC